MITFRPLFWFLIALATVHLLTSILHLLPS